MKTVQHLRSISYFLQSGASHQLHTWFIERSTQMFSSYRSIEWTQIILWQRAAPAITDRKQTVFCELKVIRTKETKLNGMLDIMAAVSRYG